MRQAIRPVMLMILDGFGWREDAADNAVRQARKPNFDRLWRTCPTRSCTHRAVTSGYLMARWEIQRSGI